MELIKALLDSLNLDSGKIALILLVIRVAGEAFSSLKNGGGLIGLGRSILYGQNVPKPIAQDYKAELASKKENPPGNG